jgi:hypothetical protein
MATFCPLRSCCVHEAQTEQANPDRQQDRREETDRSLQAGEDTYDTPEVVGSEKQQ